MRWKIGKSKEEEVLPTASANNNPYPSSGSMPMGNNLAPSPATSQQFVPLQNARMSRDSVAMHTRRSQNPAALAAAQHTVMVHHIYQQLLLLGWLNGATPASYRQDLANSKSAEIPETDFGVMLRQDASSYLHQPQNLSESVINAVTSINATVAVSISTHITEAIFDLLNPDQKTFAIPEYGRSYQIIDSLEDIASGSSGRIKKLQYACFVKKERLVLFWAEDVQGIVPQGNEFLNILLSHIWGGDSFTPTPIQPAFSPYGQGSAANSVAHFETPDKKGMQFQLDEVDTELEAEDAKHRSDESLGRPLNFVSCIFTGLACGLIVFLLFGIGLSTLITECLWDGNWIRCAIAVTIPAVFCISLFFFFVLMGDIFQIFGPISGISSNSRFYSGKKPNLSRAYRLGFTPPHVTIQMPVYKESLSAVIEPTVRSLKAAISQYEFAGGTATIFINDDGMQALPEAQQIARQEFYHNNNIGWVARPAHGDNGFLRAGKFKKASNMNFALNVAIKVEDTLRDLIANHEKDDIDERTYDALYDEALDKVLADDHRAWAAGNIRVGEFILIVDSDTRVPQDCLIYGAAEMFLSPEVAIVQHSCGVMQVVGDYFENAITFFTNMVYASIRYSVAMGEVSPFVGHNAFLRWQAVQSVAVKDESGIDKFWSESHVSEDFDISLRLQVGGNVIRYATYHNGEFKEGVSLTVYDELARWEKYAYGCNELVFNPMVKWLWKGPITPLFRTFLWSNIPLSSKMSITAYIATYYAIAVSLPLTIFNYFYIGWENNDGIDNYYLSGQSFRIWLSVLVIFSGLGNIALPILSYRLSERPLLKSLMHAFKWLPIFTIFFGSISFHVARAIFCQMFQINMVWGATAKELEKSNFFLEVPKIFSRFKWMYMVILPTLGAAIYLGTAAPHGWQIKGLTALAPLLSTCISHAIMPFVLNPALMIFDY